MVRFEILLPLFYNDARPVEGEKFLQTDDELVRLFGATSTDTVTVRGQWLYRSTLYDDRLVRARVDVDDSTRELASHAPAQRSSKNSF